MKVNHVQGIIHKDLQMILNELSYEPEGFGADPTLFLLSSHDLVGPDREENCFQTNLTICSKF